MLPCRHASFRRDGEGCAQHCAPAQHPSTAGHASAPAFRGGSGDSLFPPCFNPSSGFSCFFTSCLKYIFACGKRNVAPGTMRLVLFQVPLLPSRAAGGPVRLLLSLGDLWRWPMSPGGAQAGIPGWPWICALAKGRHLWQKQGGSRAAVAVTGPRQVSRGS